MNSFNNGELARQLMIKINCSSLCEGIIEDTECDKTLEADNEDELRKKVKEHLMNAHAAELGALEQGEMDKIFERLNDRE